MDRSKIAKQGKLYVTSQGDPDGLQPVPHWLQ